MSDEFDDAMDLQATAAPGKRRSGGTRRASRLVARLFVSAGTPLRARLISCLLRPLGPLGAAGVAAGAFAVFLHPQRGIDLHVDPAAVARVSASQVHELAHFVEQVDPQVLHQVAGLMAGSPESKAPIGATALVLLYRELPPQDIEG